MEFFFYIVRQLVSALLNKHDTAVVTSWSLFGWALALASSAFLSKKLFGEPKWMCGWILKFSPSQIAIAFVCGASAVLSSAAIGFMFGDYLFCDNPSYMYRDFAEKVLYSITPVLSEELFHRGFLLWVLVFAIKNKWRFQIAVLVQAIIFSLLHSWHGGPAWSSYYVQLRGFNIFLVGFILNLLVLRTGSIWPGVGFHLASNSAIAILGGGTGIYMLLCRQNGPHILIHSLLCLGIATVLYRQMDWQRVEQRFSAS
jgi:membrane protease YdiL (CAAX protease family)